MDVDQMETQRSPGGWYGRVVAFALEAIPLFDALSEQDRDRLADVCSDVAVDAGTTLVHEGDFGYAMYAIVSGSADVSKDGSFVRALGPGDVFGEIAVLSGGRRTASVTATTPMKLVVVLNRDVWQLERDHPEAGAALRKTIADCLERRPSG
jgi:CRP-like cAMP-binding protein